MAEPNGVFCRIGSFRFPENIYYHSYLCRCISSAAGLHAGVQQVLLQSGSGVYPFVELVDGSLTLESDIIYKS